jgi:hypothetical protein
LNIIYLLQRAYRLAARCAATVVFVTALFSLQKSDVAKA